MRKISFVILTALVWADVAHADEARVHVTGGGAHAIGGTQEREFGSGGGGAGTVELAVGNVIGIQASAGALVLSADKAPNDASIAKQSTGTALMGTVGVRFRPLGAFSVAGPWIDANGGVAETGNQTRVALDAHLGWDFRVSKSSRWDVGPFVGFTEILQPNVTFRPDDAHVLWAGVQVSLGASERRVAPAPAVEQQPEPPLRDFDGMAQVEDICPVVDAEGNIPPGCPTPEAKLVEDRIVLSDIIHFEFNSPVIHSRSYALLRNLARLINDHPAILEVSIEGHADARGTEEYNLRLSEARAQSTRALLVRFGVDEPRLRVVGYGKTKLKVQTPDADPRNRRVEFLVTRSAESSTARVPLRHPPSPSPIPKVASGKRGQP